MSILDPSSDSWQRLAANLNLVVTQALAKFQPPEKISSTDWANRNRYLAQESSPMPGKYSTDLTPWVPGMLDALDDTQVKKVVCRKSAQVAWTDGVWNNYLGRRIHNDPCPIVLLFPKDKTIRKYLDQKFVPMVEASPVLRPLVDVSTSRTTGNRTDYKKFPGGFLALVASNAPDNVKSLSAPVVCVEEPDDCNTNVRGQGDSINLLEERAKTYEYRKVIFGGTPTVKGLSRVDEAFQGSDQRMFMVPCHECGDEHVLSWENVVWNEDNPVPDEVLGKAQTETARYACPHCGVLWRDVDKNRNVRKGYWKAHKPFRGVAGFYINELYSPFPGSKLALLVEKYLKARHALEQGDDSYMIGFVNNTLGLSYEYQTDAPDTDTLRERAENYVELSVPAGGLVLTVGVDVQHDRLAIIVRAWGRGEESWLVFWGEIYAAQSCTDKADPVWDELDKFIFGAYSHGLGFNMPVSAASIDSSDGQTNDAVYHYVRSRKGRGVKVMAIKGESNNLNREIVTPAKKVDVNSKTTKAARYGLPVFMVGTEKAKDLIDARLKLTGNGPGRMHWYSNVRDDYYSQITAEIKAPDRKRGGRKTWQPKAGVRNEGLDCEVYALHAARTLKVHVRKPDQWDALEAQLMQGDLLAPTPPAPVADNKPRATQTKTQNSKPEGRSLADIARRMR
ncbi:phage terminase large subunit family protein [Marinobacter sp. G11]|uniref:phage terminase large subunit family protein n=1 Tax=Marinobacter sp. G11 TaxID=2903522 RepID=UPI001E2E4957|nr:phage terminase large subunit family protein [Marinobacter sp. G11]MCE0760680.1 phage terminase large subunit family protein [Marinobacter sp. G11]